MQPKFKAGDYIICLNAIAPEPCKITEVDHFNREYVFKREGNRRTVMSFENEMYWRLVPPNEFDLHCDKIREEIGL